MKKSKEKTNFKKEAKENGDLYEVSNLRDISKYFLDNFKQVIHPSKLT